LPLNIIDQIEIHRHLICVLNTQMDTFKLLLPVLSPIAALCVRRGIKLQELLETVKRAFVLAAEQELARSGEKQNVSRISLMTGLQRSDVTRIKRLPAAPSYAINLTTRIIGQWCNSKTFSSKGLPKPLPMRGGANSFVKLVESVSKDVNPATVLFELERIGAVKKEKKTIELTARGFSPLLEREDEALELLGADIADLTASVEDNLLQRSPEPNLHITTRYDNVAVDAIPQIRKWLLKRGSEFQAQVRAYVSRFDKDLNPSLFKSQGGASVTLGTFSVTNTHNHTARGDENDVIE
jgi:hypothetical protein